MTASLNGFFHESLFQDCPYSIEQTGELAILPFVCFSKKLMATDDSETMRCPGFPSRTSAPR
ncbi:hypothetical protein WI75_03220 [Burkholderia ubonensis]|nr:hypothetical protein WI75_03220 [Burkholderia ubonensis]KVT96606.1 hypothetical protein WK60_08725 [Burkholderia ubonensis]